MHHDVIMHFSKTFILFLFSQHYYLRFSQLTYTRQVWPTAFLLLKSHILICINLCYLLQFFTSLCVIFFKHVSNMHFVLILHGYILHILHVRFKLFHMDDMRNIHTDRELWANGMEDIFIEILYGNALIGALRVGRSQVGATICTLNSLLFWV